MINKDSLRTKIIKRFYGITGEYDEYKEHEVNRIGNNAFIILWCYVLISTFIATLFASKYPIEALKIYLGCNIFVTIFVVNLYLVIASKKSMLTEIDVTKEDYNTAKTSALITGIKSGLIFGFCMYFLKGLIDVSFDNITFSYYFSSLKNILTSICNGLIFGLFSYVVSRNRIKKEK